MSERIRVADVCTITGMQPRQVQQMAKAHQIPSAAQFGKLWTFHGPTVKAWAKRKEEPSWQTTSTAVEKSGGIAFRLPGTNYAKVYEQLLGRKRSGDSSSRRTR